MTIGNRLVDLAREGYDVAIHIVKDPGLNVVVRELAPVRRKVCATLDYFRHHGVPESPCDLTLHNCIIYNLPDSPGRPLAVHGKERDRGARLGKSAVERR
jgi:DNA-binding transcriptional LysR family regulator